MIFKLAKLTALAGLIAAAPAFAQDTKVTIAMSGWTGFAPLTLAKEADLFKKRGLDVTIKKIPQKDRHLVLASGDIRAPPPRSRPGSSGTPTASRRRRSSSSTRATVPTAWSSSPALPRSAT